MSIPLHAASEATFSQTRPGSSHAFGYDINMGAQTKRPSGTRFGGEAVLISPKLLPSDLPGAQDASRLPGKLGKGKGKGKNAKAKTAQELAGHLANFAQGTSAGRPAQDMPAATTEASTGMGIRGDYDPSAMEQAWSENWRIGDRRIPE